MLRHGISFLQGETRFIFKLYRMKAIIAVALGSALGGTARYLISEWMGRFDTMAPLGTWVANLLGCFLIGLLVPLLSRFGVSELVRLMLLTGFLGSLTTFSTFSLESWVFLKEGDLVMALVNMVGSLVLGVLLVALGMRTHDYLF